MSLLDTDPNVAAILVEAANRIKDRTELCMVLMRLGELAKALQTSYSQEAIASIIDALAVDCASAPAERMP